MTREMIFDIWAPAGSRWSPWVKPILFSFMSEIHVGASVPESSTTDLSWLPPADGSTLLVLDLPTAQAASDAVEFAKRGYRPVPLYNASPWEENSQLAEIAPPLVDVGSIVHALRAVTPLLAMESLSDTAPPAFLLDWNRRVPMRAVEPGCLDNRSVSFPTDFPSANFLLAHGLRRVVLVQRYHPQPQADLAHTLRAWQNAGLAIEVKELDEAGAPRPVEVSTPSFFGKCFYHALKMLGFKRSTLGGFGGILPEASSG
jgi:hypothetical protein